jgi:hypothetical protein
MLLPPKSHIFSVIHGRQTLYFSFLRNTNLTSGNSKGVKEGREKAEKER